jgi:hypothetical protein
MATIVIMFDFLTTEATMGGHEKDDNISLQVCDTSTARSGEP